ncbi:MAG TPA: DUF4331 family protein [Bryobacteraceae bacterium]|jgi:hypothetical protein
MRQRLLFGSAIAACLSGSLFAASHRNGPLLLEDQTANLNDFYIFRSYETGKFDRLVMSMSTQGFQNPDNGPSYYKFSDSVLYRFSINNSRGLAIPISISTSLSKPRCARTTRFFPTWDRLRRSIARES